MIKYVSGDILDAKADAIINTVNTKGAMGAGLAKQVAQRYPAILEPYKTACHAGRLRPGGAQFLRVNRATGARDIDGDLWIINLATKDHWRDPSRIEWIEYAMANLGSALTRFGIRSVAIPKLGAGLGGLEWESVREIIETNMRPYADEGLQVLIYGEPPHQNGDA